VIFLNHSAAAVSLNTSEGSQVSFTVFGSPYVPARGNWAFGYEHNSNQAAALWNDIPLDTDIVVTHTPPYNHCDASPKWGAAGCKELRKALWRIRPLLVVCGHVHEARGVERVIWRLDLPYTPYLEESTDIWMDPGAGNKKMSKVDLTISGGKPLDNDGSLTRRTFENRVSFSPDIGHRNHSFSDEEEEFETTETTSLPTHSTTATISTEEAMSDPHYDLSSHSMARLSRLDTQNLKALAGRMHRRETCIVNAAIMARSWGNGPKRYNKPIIIDLDLPVRNGEGEIFRTPVRQDSIPNPLVELSDSTEPTTYPKTLSPEIQDQGPIVMLTRRNSKP